MSFWENFTRICKERNTTPTTIVKNDLGFSSSKVQLWKNGSLPKEEMLHLLAQELKVSVADFFKDEPEIPEEVTTDDEKDILEIYRHLDRKQKHEFMAMVYQYDREIQKGDSSEKIG